MSSTAAGIPYSQVDFLTRWMPSSTKAGVILNPSPDLAESLRYTYPPCTPGLPTPEPDEGDSCASDIAPLPASADSSCLGVHEGGDRYRAEVSSDSQDAPIMMKLGELRRWQQHMQEQLKADQLGELLHLQDEQQRLLRMMNTSHLGTEGAEHEASSPRQIQYSPTVNCLVNPWQEETLTQLQSGQNGIQLQDQENGTRTDATKKQFDGSSSRQSDETAFTRNNSREDDSVLKDRPITAGKQTFEELLEEQLRMEEQRLKSLWQQQKPNGGDSPKTKRAFLRRGQGLSRFANSSKSSFPKEDTTSESKPATPAGVAASMPICIQTGAKKASQRFLVQRKTATLNKENRQVDRKMAQTKVLRCHQRQNTEHRNGDVLVGRPSKQVQHSHTAEACCPHLAVTTPVATEHNCVPRPESPDECAVAGVPQDPSEASSLEKVRRWECERQLESMELGEFELLEQAAEELSFSSTSSFVTKVLQMDQQNRRLLSAIGLHQRRLSSTPIKSPPTREQRCSPGSHVDGGSACGAAKKNKVRFDDEEDSTSTPGADIKEPEGSVLRVVSPCSLPSRFPVPSEPMYDRRSYQNEDVICQCLDAGSEDGNVISSTDSTLTENKDAPLGQVVFDDDDTWNDLDNTAVSEAEPVSTRAANQEPEAPPSLPPSKLMVKLFPSLQPNTQNPPVPPPPPHDKKTDEEAGQCVQSAQLKERLVQLEIEIERFQKENAALAKLRQENEKNQENLRRECAAMDQQRAEQLAHFEDYKKEETRKLQRERKLFEKHAAAVRAVPDKKEREEIQALKEQLSSLQEELRKKESRWSSTHSRLRQQMDSLSQENLALRDQVRALEKLRLSALKKNSPEAERDTKDVSSLTKGVKFASPVDSRGSASPPSCSTASAASGNFKDGRQPAHSLKALKSSLRKHAQSGPSSSAKNPQPILEHSHSSSLPRDGTPSQPTKCSKEEDAQEVITYPDGKVEKVLASSDRIIIFPNGTRKELSSDGVTVKFTFFNGDTKVVTADRRVIYYYTDAQTTHITYPDGVEVLHFPNNQTEKHFPDGRKEITFADQTVKNLFPDGSEECVLMDGTVMHVKPNGTKEIHFNTGQREVHTDDYKRREYPDGTVKTVYTDGRQETRYPTGRLRIKDKDGNVVTDSKP